MGRHGRHRQSPLRDRPRDDGRAAGWRLVVKTPWFALGVSVVAAALLAIGTTQTYLKFSGSGPDNGCAAATCANPAASPSPSPDAPQGDGGSPAVRIAYRTLSSTATGFTGELTISNRSGSGLTGWRLAIAYRHAQISHVRGAQWLPGDRSTSGTIEPASPSDPLDAGRPVRITYTATGTPHAPIACAFNGTRCKIK